MFKNMQNEWFFNIRGDLLSGLVVALALIPEAIAFCQWPLLLIHFRPLKLTHLRSGFIHFLLQSVNGNVKLTH